VEESAFSEGSGALGDEALAVAGAAGGCVDAAATATDWAAGWVAARAVSSTSTTAG
jgi:hypothetical protein